MRSIQRTSTLLIVVCIGAVLTLGQLSIDSIISSRLQSRFDDALHAKARALVTLTKFDGVEVDLDFADEFMPEFEAHGTGDYFELFLDNGELLERSRTFRGYPESMYEDPSRELAFHDFVLPDGRQGRRVIIDYIPQIEDKSIREFFPDEIREHAVLRVSTERESLNRALQQLHVVLATIGVVVVIAASVCVVFAMRIGLRPIDKMRSQIAAIDADSIDRRVKVDDQPVELAPIAQQFNDVLDRIESAFQRERRFSSDVAHELRTPVAELKAFAEVGLRWPQDRDVRDFFTHVLDASDHLDKVVGNLLALCRGDSGQITVNLQRVRLARIVDDAWAACSDVATTKNVRLVNDLEQLPPIVSDPLWLELIVVNIINNAVEHGSANSEIACGFEIGTACTVHFTNHCEELDTVDVQHVFDRFWRKDVARTGGRHVGIGLALVESYAAQLGVGVDVQLIEGKFRITLSGFELGATSDARTAAA